MHRKDKAKIRQASGGIPSSPSPPCSPLFCWSSGDCKEEAYNREEEAEEDGDRGRGLRGKRRTDFEELEEEAEEGMGPLLLFLVAAAVVARISHSYGPMLLLLLLLPLPLGRA